MKKSILSFIVLLIAVIAIMVIPKSGENNQAEEQTTTMVSEETNTTEEKSEAKEEKEPLGGIRIGTSNLIVLLALGSILAINKIREIKAGQSKSKDE